MKIFESAANAFHAHGVCFLHLDQYCMHFRGRFSQFVTKLLCLSVATFHFDVTFYTHAIRLPVAAHPLSISCVPCYIVSLHKSSLSMHVAMFSARVTFEISIHSPNFLDAPCILLECASIHPYIDAGTTATPGELGFRNNDGNVNLPAVNNKKTDGRYKFRIKNLL